MLEGAYAHIFGKLHEDIIINEANNGKRYGILSVSVTHHVENGHMEIGGKTNIFQIVIWNEVILHKQWQSFKKGKRVFVFGELSTIDRIVLRYGTPCNTIIMDVRDRFRVEILT